MKKIYPSNPFTQVLHRCSEQHGLYLAKVKSSSWASFWFYVTCAYKLCPLNAIQSLSEQFRILSASLRLLYEGSLVLMLCSFFPWEKMLHSPGKFLKTQETNNSISSGSPWNWADSKGLHFTNINKHLWLLRDTLSQTELPQRNRNQASGLEKTQINWNAWRRHSPTAWAAWWLCKEFQFSSFCEL